MKIVDWIKEHKWLLLIVSVGAFLRCYKLDFQSPWIDEIFSLIQGNPNKTYKEIYYFIKKFDPHPPLYYFSVHFFFGLLGDSVFSARLLSAIYGIAGLFAIYFLGKELSNKKTGLIAAALLSVNTFHITYSQEIRMYTLLVLTTTISFYCLARFIKVPSFKRLLIYTLSAALMIYTQFFGLFLLFSQYVILLYFVIKPYQITRLRFFLYCFLAGILTLILYLPALYILAEATATDFSWIPLPGAGFFIQLFNAFFGDSIAIVFFMLSGIVLYFVHLFKHRKATFKAIDPVNEKQAFSFFFLFTWILVTFLIPFIISYINKPMLVSRYLICILPPILVIAAAGFSYIKNKAVQAVAIAAVLVFSVTDLFLVKDYYNTVTKEQFREVTTEIIQRNSQRSKIVMYWSWLLPYFFKDTPTELKDGNLEDYVIGLKNNANSKTAFWYVDGHSRPFALSPEAREFLAQNFILKEKIEYHDAWAHYYVPIGAPDVVTAPVSQQKTDTGLLGIGSFEQSTRDASGNIVLFENATLETDSFDLEKGRYELVVRGKSFPDQPINNESAHIIIKMAGVQIANFNLSEKADAPEKRFAFTCSQDKSVHFSIIYDNDALQNGKDRNALISGIRLEKK